MLIRWNHLAGLVIAAVVLAFLVAWSGVIGVGASSGHWKVTDWFLHWVMRSSVATAAIGTEVPPLHDGRLPAAAGHFETACAICHGSPAAERPRSVDGMLPVPPDLKPVIPTWTDAELFQIVQHGVRFTGMPAWPVRGREDEVWAMVAFLRAYPGLDADGYRRLVRQENQAGDRFGQIVDRCGQCHQPDGLAGDAIVPVIAGQKTEYLRHALEAYAEGTRPSGIMAVALETISADDRRRLADHFAAQPVPTAISGTDNRPVAHGETLAARGDPTRGIPACLSCHDGKGLNAAYPNLSGQPYGYLAEQIRLFAEKKRGGGPYSVIMIRAASGLEPGDIEALSAYFSRRSSSKD